MKKYKLYTPVLCEFGEEFEHGCGDLRVAAPNLERAQQDGRVGGEDPLEEHHVARLVVEGEGDAAQVANQTDQLTLPHRKHNG